MDARQPAANLTTDPYPTLPIPRLDTLSRVSRSGNHVFSQVASTIQCHGAQERCSQRRNILGYTKMGSCALIFEEVATINGLAKLRAWKWKVERGPSLGIE
jgi:hypothetical protein